MATVKQSPLMLEFTRKMRKQYPQNAHYNVINAICEIANSNLSDETKMWAMSNICISAKHDKELPLDVVVSDVTKLENYTKFSIDFYHNGYKHDSTDFISVPIPVV